MQTLQTRAAHNCTHPCIAPQSTPTTSPIPTPPLPYRTPPAVSHTLTPPRKRQPKGLTAHRQLSQRPRQAEQEKNTAHLPEDGLAAAACTLQPWTRSTRTLAEWHRSTRLPSSRKVRRRQMHGGACGGALTMRALTREHSTSIQPESHIAAEMQSGTSRTAHWSQSQAAH
jgi:hypothetical protein